MELYVFNHNRQLSGVVESYEYLRWTRRYVRCGSFELIAIATPENVALLKEGHILQKSGDQEAGIIERVELSQTEREIIMASGRFATSFLSRRIIWGTETLRGDLSAAVSQLITKHLISPTDNTRKITGFAFSATTLGVSVSSQTSYRNLMEAVCDLCDGLEVGIKTAFDPATGIFTVSLYMGGAASVVFSKEYENLTEQIYTESVDGYANTALIGGEGEGSARQFVTIAQGSGENRREVFVDARDLQSADFPNNYTETLTFRGQSRLAELAPRYSFDAAVNPHGNLRYKTDFDLGQSVRVVSKSWGVTLSARITEIEETYDMDGQSLQLTFGKSELTLAQKMRSYMSGMKTAILAPSGGGPGEIPDASITAAKVADNAITSGKIAAGAVTTAAVADVSITAAKIATGAVAQSKIADGAVAQAKLADNAVTSAKINEGAVTLPKINTSILPSTANTYAQRLLTNTYQDAGAVNLNDYMTFGEYTLYNITTATNFPTGTWTGSGNTAHLIVQRYYSNAAVRQILTKRNSPNDIWTRTASSASSWTAWYRIPALGDGSEIATANIANLAVTAAKIANSTITTAKIAQEADTGITISWASGITLAGTQNSYTNKGVVVLGFQIQVSSGTPVAPGGTLCTISSAAFRPYATVRSVLVPVPTYVNSVPITIETNGVIKNAASGTTLPAGYYMISVSYARA